MICSGRDNRIAQLAACEDQSLLVHRGAFMSPAEQLQRERISRLATTLTLEWMAESYAFLLSLTPADVQSRALAAMKGEMRMARQDQVDLLDPALPPEQARLEAAWFREAFDEAAATVELRLGLGRRASNKGY